MSGGLATISEIQFDGHTIRLAGRAGDPYFDEISQWKTSNVFLCAVLSRSFKPDFISLDVGANIGLTACLMARTASAGKVYAFEPSPTAFPNLQESLRASAIANVEAFQLAAGARNGELPFENNSHSESASHLSKGALGRSTDRVPVVTIDRFVRQRRIARVNFIKIDVEGFELDVLKGARSTLRKHRPIVLLEFNSFTLIAYGNQNPRSVIRSLVEQFPFVYRRSGATLLRIQDDQGMLDFIYNNLIRNECVEDLLCAFEPVDAVSF